MGGRECRDDGNQRSKPPQRNDQTHEEQQVIGACEDVLEAELDESKGRLMPSRVQADASRDSRGTRTPAQPRLAE